jgi:hypothetical protein
VISRGVRRGSHLSPLLFSTAVEPMMLKTMEGIEDRVGVGSSEHTKDVRFAHNE